MTATPPANSTAPTAMTEPLSALNLLEAISMIQSRFIENAPQSALLAEILNRLMTLTESQYGFLCDVRHSPSGEVYFKMQVVSDSAWKSMARDFYERHAPIGMEFERLRQMFGSACGEGEVVIKNQIAIKHMPEGHPPLNCFLGLPIFNGGELQGMVGLANGRQGYSSGMAEFLQPLLAICGSIIKAWRVDSWRREVEEDLRRHAMVFENISDAVILSDGQGIVLDCNRAAEKMFDLPRKKLIGVPLAFLMTAPDGDTVAAAITQITADGRWNGRFALSQHGEQHVYEATALRLHGHADEESLLAWFNRDVSERERARTRLEERSLELNAILDLSPAGYVFIDVSGRVAYVNPAFEQMTGMSAAQTIGMNSLALDLSLAALCAPAHVPAPVSAEEDTLQLQRPRFAILRRIRRALADASGVPRGQVLCFQDITREAEVDRLKSEFLSTAAHELRTPMASVFGFSELLLKREVDADKQRQFIGIIHRQAGRLAAIINELLDLARIDAMEGKDFHIASHDLAPVIRQTLAELLVPGDERSVSLSLPPDLPPVCIDPEKMHLALTNVLSNAYKYSFGSGEISLRVFHGDGARAGWLGIEVCDQGIGMDAAQLARVFDRFWRADSSGKVAGTGLGMSLVKEIMGIFNGAVAVDSQPGSGTKVSLWLPVASH